jgi:hypothetical protein
VYGVLLKLQRRKALVLAYGECISVTSPDT